LVEGSARVGGGVPIFSRARAFTADAALKGFGFCRFAAISVAGAVRILSALLQDSLHLVNSGDLCHALLDAPREVEMSIQTEEELRQLRIVGMIVRKALNAMTGAAEPGITTAELDAICAHVLAEHGATSAPRKVYNFPGTCCISVNDEAIHGVPGRRTLIEGDLMKLDVTAEKDGYYADAAVHGSSWRSKRDRLGAGRLCEECLPGGDARRESRLACSRDWPRGAARGASSRIQRPARVRRPRYRPHDS
jgi:hypothetical protein